MDLFSKLKIENLIPPTSPKSGHFVVDSEIGIALLASYLYRDGDERILLITSNLYKAQKLYSLLCSFNPKDEVLLFPSDELIRAETLAQSKEMTAHRLYVLSKIVSDKARFVIANVSSATRYLPEIDLFKNSILDLKVGDCFDISELKRKLITMGYSRVSKVDQSLQFASRGDILDIFSVNNDNPIRIEFFGDEIESIRTFDIATQTSISPAKSTYILPASDILFTENEFKNIPEKLMSQLEKDKEIISDDTFINLRNQVDDDLLLMAEGQFNERLYKYYSYLKNRHFSIFDYCSNYKKILIDLPSLQSSNEMLQNDSLTYLGELFETGKVISHLEMYQDLFKLISLQDRNLIFTSSLIETVKETYFPVKNVPFVSTKKEDALNIIQSYLNDNYKIILCLPSQENISLLKESFLNFGIEYENTIGFDVPEKCNIGISISNLDSGFIISELKIAYLTATELFNEKVKSARLDNRFKEATILKSYEDLTPGDYVVHEYQGIGCFVGLDTVEVEGKRRDYLKISYFGNEYLYVPLEQFQLVRKYLGKEGLRPRLSHLHSNDWENTKKKAKARINDLAERLMNLYIARSKVKGYSFPKDDEFQLNFEKNFQYNLTHDQERAVNEIKEDMEKEFPMDRLLCADVGFGKTEVAFRAAFKAINAGKQVAILCPTTLLARQHYELALERFSGFDIDIAIFSRLVPESKQKECIKKVADGKCHLIIGTHRILSKEIHFKDLGLLIVDEEQRFGVEQKERIKELKNNLDVLTLTATPIPRTLQISLLGVRSMSKIDTPPKDRMPIQTYVTPFRVDVVKELIERELGRQGQVFFLHNDISTLYMRVNHLQKLIPSAKIGVAHGKMNREDIEDVMIKFYKGEIDILVCTSIVENGIDVPNANMIIVEDSEKYGLSQLYQIKGRVGRGNKIAYAYLMYNGNKILNEKTTKRLQALQEFTELGSGYKIAQRDLLIRGAGDILGPEQAGFIDSIGLDMYIKLLNEAVKEKLNGEKPEEIVLNPTLSLEAYIPNNYANDQEKIELYQEIMSCSDREVLARIKNRTLDIYGKMPKEVNQLFVKRNIDILSKDALVDKIEENSNHINIILSKTYINIRGIGNILFESLIPYLKVLKLSYANNTFKIQVNKTPNWLNDLENILLSLVNILDHNKSKEIV